MDNSTKLDEEIEALESLVESVKNHPLMYPNLKERLERRKMDRVMINFNNGLTSEPIDFDNE